MKTRFWRQRYDKKNSQLWGVLGLVTVLSLPLAQVSAGNWILVIKLNVVICTGVYVERKVNKNSEIVSE